MICSRRMLAISFWRFCCFAVDWAKVRNVMKRKQFVITSNETGTNWKQTIVSRFSLTLADSLQLFFKKETNQQMDGWMLFTEYQMIVSCDDRFRIGFADDLVLLSFPSWVCLLFIQSRWKQKKQSPYLFFFFDLVAAVKKPQNAFASCRVLLRPSGLISFAFFHRRVEWIIFYDAIGFSSSSRCFQLALIYELPVRPSVDAE